MEKMKIGAAAWGFRELELSQRLQMVKRIGLTSLELGIANSPNDIQTNADVQMLEQIKKRYEFFGISLDFAAAGNDFTLEDEGAVTTDIIKIKRVIEICSFLGIKVLRIFAGFSPVEEVDSRRFAGLIDALNLVTWYGKEHGVTIAMETHGGVASYPDGVVHYHSVTTEVKSLWRILKETDDSLKIVFDPANLYAIPGSNVEEILDLVGSRVAYAHIKDFVGSPGGRLKPGAVGDEKRDWKTIIKHILRRTDSLMIEYEEPLDVEEGTRRSKVYLETVIKEIEL